MLDLEAVLNKSAFIKKLTELGLTDTLVQEKEWKLVQSMFATIFANKLYEALPENYRGSLPSLEKIDTETEFASFSNQLINYANECKGQINLEEISKKAIEQTYKVYFDMLTSNENSSAVSV